MAAEFGDSVVRQIDQFQFLQPLDLGQREFGHVVVRQIDFGQLGERQQRVVQMPDAVVAQFQHFDHFRLFELVGRQLYGKTKRVLFTLKIQRI